MDWDNDGLKDLISGDTNGSVWYFRNTGTVKNPELARGKLIKAGGKIIKKSITYENGVKIGTYSKLHIADWNGDGLIDILIGNTSEMLYYKNTGNNNDPSFAAPIEMKHAGGKFPDRPSPYVIDWDKDGVVDLLVGTDRGAVFFHRNTGTNKDPELAKGKEVELVFDYDQIPMRQRFDIVDWNNDGIEDIIMGEFHSEIVNGKRSTNGNVWLFLGKK